MKKFTKVSMIAALSASALTPVIGFAAENDVTAEHAAPGLYNVETGQVITIVEFQFYTLEQKLEILTNEAFYLANGEGKVLKLTNVITAEDDATLEAAFEDETAIEEEFGIELTPDGTVTKGGVNLGLATAIAAAEAAIAELPAVEELTLEDEAAVDAAQALVNVVLALDENAVIANLDVLVAAQAKIEELKNPATDLTVESVSAINATIASGEETELKFVINGTDELTKVEFEEKYEGYTAAFLFNKSTGNGQTFDKVTGKVTATDSFKYAVEVSKDGEKVNTATSADFVEVKVVDATVATSVQEIELQNESDSKEWKSSTVTAKDEVKIVASVYSNALGQSNTDKDENDVLNPANIDAPEVEKVTSSDVTTAYYEDGKIVVLADGEVTFTVKFTDIKETKTITVQAVATQEVTAISADAQKVKAETAGQTVSFTVLDQNNEAVRVNETEVFYTLTKSGDVEADAATSVKTDATGKASVGVNKAEGDYTVNVYTKADKKTKIGSFAVETINVADDAVIDKYELTFADEDTTSVDLNPGKDAATLVVDAKASISGIDVELPGDVKVKSSNEDVFAVSDLEAGKTTVTAAKTGKANVVLYTEEGDLVTVLATLEVEVVNTATQFTTLTLKPDTKVDGKASDLKQAVIDAVKEEVTADQIEKVTALAADGKVLVKFEAAYGGKTISLDATFADTTLTKADAVIVKAADTEAKDAVATTTTELDVSAIEDGGTIVVEGETYTVATSFSLTDLNTAIASTGVVATGTDTALVLTKADGTDFTYAATTDGSTELFASTDVTNGEEAEDAVAGEVLSGTITLTFSEAVNVEAAATININGTIAGTVAEKVEGKKTVTLTLDAANAKKVTNAPVSVLDLKAINGSDIVLPENDAAVKITVVTTVAP